MHGDLQFVVIPKEIDGRDIQAVLLLKDYFRFGAYYRGKRKYDIVFLILKKPREEVDPTKVIVWDTPVTDKRDDFAGMNVAGSGIKAPVVDRNAAYDKKSSCWYFMIEGNPESGNSGSAMLCFSKESGSKYVLANKQEQKSKRIKPHLMGVYTGMGSVAKELHIGKSSLHPSLRRFRFYALFTSG